jgi:hypothetical protein
MDLSDRLVEHDHWLTARLLENAAALPDDVLDRPVRPGLVVHAFEGPEPDVRTMLAHRLHQGGVDRGDRRARAPAA